MKDYRGEAQITSDIGDHQGFAIAKAAYRYEARAYLDKGLAAAAGSDIGPVEPRRKRHRVKSLEWGLAVDNCLLFCTGAGFGKFDVTASIRESKCPYDWPALSVAPDQGPDGYCFLNALQHGGIEGRLFNIEVSLSGRFPMAGLAPFSFFEWQLIGNTL